MKVLLIFATEFSIFLAILLLFGFIGFASGHFLLGVFIATAGYLAWHLLNLYYTLSWLTGKRKNLPTYFLGTWQSLSYIIHRQHRRYARDRRRLKKSEKIRRDFIANISHELRTPLTVLHGYLETLIDQTSAEQNQSRKSMKDIFDQMQRQTTRMNALLTDLMLLTQLETTHAKPQKKESIDIQALLTQLVHDARVLGSEKKHHIELNCPNNLKLFGIKGELYSAFSNLIQNAIRYTPMNGKIIITGKIEKEKLIISVEDNGEGIEITHIPRLTERFYRVDPARSRTSGGTGLGLAIVKHILIRHQGHLEIESQIGVGSRFQCVFPYLD